MKRKVFAISLVLALLISAVGFNTVFVSAEAADPALKIEGQNLCFEDSVYLEYAVSSTTDVSVSLLIWLNPQDAYTVGTQDYKLSPYKQDTVNNKPCDIFVFTELAAKQMTDDVFAVAYTKIDGEDYYSPVKKYSILQYAYNKLNADDASPELKTLLSAMLQYGAAAQTCFNYKTDRLANATYHKVKVVGGTLADGSASGLFQAGETANMVAADGFHHWENADGEHIGFDKAVSATVDGDTTFVAVQAENTYSLEATVGSWDPATVVIPTNVAAGTEVLVSAKAITFNCWDSSAPMVYALKSDLSGVATPEVANNAALKAMNGVWTDISFLTTVANDGAIHLGMYPVNSEFGQRVQLHLYNVSVQVLGNKLTMNLAYNLNDGGWGAFGYMPSDLPAGTAVTVKAMVKAYFGGAESNTKSPTLYYAADGVSAWTVLADYNTLTTYSNYTEVTFDAVVGANGLGFLFNPADQITSQWGPSEVTILPISITAK